MNEKPLKILIYIAGIVCLYAFVAIRIPPLFNAVLKEKIIPEYWENTKYGELYYFNHIRHFREKDLPLHDKKYRFSEKHPSLDKADIFLFGDSFLDFTRMKTFPEMLGDTLNQKAFYARYDRPLQYFAEQQFDNNVEKILLYESAERYIPTRFSETHPKMEITDSRSKVRQHVANVRDFLFLPNADLLYGTLLSRNILTTGIFSFNATLKFDVFKYITDMTPTYYLEGDIPWLFYYDQLNGEPSSFYYKHSQDEMNMYCDNIADLASKLYEQYKLKMVFMAIPSKYTICHTLMNNDPYNNFIPRLYAGLEERGIPVIHLYEDFRAAEDILYYGTDTHWNFKGLSIAVDNTVEVFESLKN
ncbi:MAG: hypothetical protein KAR19_12465 [Bacteroidales bacterium]|nr:hypothetical protein [Bacteroidales bacterium]